MRNRNHGLWKKKKKQIASLRCQSDLKRRQIWLTNDEAIISEIWLFVNVSHNSYLPRLLQISDLLSMTNQDTLLNLVH